MKRLVFLASLSLVIPAAAVPMSYDFYHDGFDGGAYVTGTFTADDINTNGQISSFSSEVLAFSMSFSGNSQVAAFTATFTEMFGVVWDLGDPVLGDGTLGDKEGIGVSTISGFSYFNGNGPLSPPPGGVISFGNASTVSQNFAMVGRYPGNGPGNSVSCGGSTAAMLGFALAGLVGMRLKLR